MTVKAESAVSEPTNTNDANYEQQLNALLMSYGQRDPSPSTTDSEEMMKFRDSREEAARTDYARLKAAAEHLSALLGKVSEILNSSNAPESRLKVALRYHVDLTEQLRQTREAIREFPSTDIDAYYAVHSDEVAENLAALREDRLVKLPYTLEKGQKVFDTLASGRPVILHGHTGSGKTELARDVALEFSGKDALLVRCHGFMGPEELFGHQALESTSVIEARRVVSLVETEFNAWKVENPLASEGQAARALELIQERLLHQNGVTVSRFIIGSVYKAVEEDRVIIFDEFNAMPDSLRVALNDILTRHAGRSVTVQENGRGNLEVGGGFGVICTANLPQDGGRSKTYVGISNLSAATLSRAETIQYDYPPQSVKGTLEENSLEKHKQGFALALYSMMNDNQAAVLPKNGLDLLWRLAQFARLAQDAFAEGIDSKNELASRDSGSSTRTKIGMPLDPRRLCFILRKWRDEGLSRELDSYLYENYVDSLVRNSDKRRMYNLAQAVGFFEKSRGWPEGDASIAELSNKPFDVDAPINGCGELQLLPRDVTLPALFGAPPARTVWPDRSEGSQRARSQQSVEQALQLEQAIAELEEIALSARIKLP